MGNLPESHDDDDDDDDDANSGVTSIPLTKNLNIRNISSMVDFSEMRL